MASGAAAVSEPRVASLLLRCPMLEGVAARLTQWVYTQGGRIVYHEQAVDRDSRHYYCCLKWDTAGREAGEEQLAQELAAVVGASSPSGDCEWSLRFSERRLRMAVFASRDPACLYDILARSHSGEWNVELPLVVANHAGIEPIARRFGVEFRLFEVDADSRDAVEAQQIALLQDLRIDFVVLARYMRILGPAFIAAYPNRIINIHHAFLPAFPGARPYHSARARGVKMIGATSHYVTETLDAGPIIEQDARRVDHRHSVDDLVRFGRDMEKLVLARAIWAHLQHKVIVHDGRTIVFD